MESDPPPTDFKWALNNSVELFDVKTFNFNGTKSVVTYKPRYANSYGTLYCWASNQIGTQKEPCAYHVVPASEYPRIFRISVELENEILLCAYM